MKYHSTKKSILTITVIISILLILSSVGIFKFQAKTPVQALSSALISNLEMPSGYNIKVENINESFLARQNIEKISLTKDDKPIISLSSLTINQSLFSYIGYIFFDKPLNFKINAKNITIDLNEDLSDLTYALSNIKVKENTIAIQSKLEKSDDIDSKQSLDIKALINEIITQQYIDLSPILKGNIVKNSYILKINEGKINYVNDDISFSSEINNLNFYLERDGILKDFDFRLSNINFDGGALFYNGDYSIISYEEGQLSFSFLNSILDYNDNLIQVKNVKAEYNLQEIGKVSAIFETLDYRNKDSSFRASTLSSNIYTNFDDISFYLSPEDAVLDINNNRVSFKKADLGFSLVDGNLSLLVENDGLFYFSINNNDFNIYNSEFTLSSENNTPNHVNFMFKSLNYNKDSLKVNLRNLTTEINGENDLTTLFNDGKFDFSKINLESLKSTYSLLTINLKTDLVLSNREHQIETNLISTVELQDNFENLSGSLIGDSLYFDDFKEAINFDINLQGPLTLSKDNVESVETVLSYGDNLSVKAVGKFNETLANNEIKASILFNNYNLDEATPYLLQVVPSLGNYLTQETSLTGSVSLDGTIVDKASNYLKGNVSSTLLIKNASFLDSNYNLGFNFSSAISDSFLDIKNLSLSLFDYRAYFTGKYITDTKSISGSLNLEDIKKGENLVNIKLSSASLNTTDFNLTTKFFPNFSLQGSFINLEESKFKVNSLLYLKSDVIDFDIDVDVKNLLFNVISSKGLNLNIDIKDTINAYFNLDNFKLIDLDNSSFDGDFKLTYKNNDFWAFNIDDFDFGYNNKLYDIVLNGEITQNLINLDKLDYYNNNYNTKFSGTLYYTGPKYKQLFENKLSDKYTLNFTFGDNIDQRIEASLFNNSDISNIFLEIKNFNISRLFKNRNETLLDTRIIGSTDFTSKNQIDGDIAIYETGSLNESTVKNIISTPLISNQLSSNSLLTRVFSFIPFINLPEQNTSTQTTVEDVVSSSKLNFSTNLQIDKSNYSLKNLNLSLDNYSIENGYFNLNVEDFTLALKSTIELLKPSVVTNQLSSFDLGLYINFKSVINSIKDQFSVKTIDINTANSIYNKLKDYKTFDYSLLNNIIGNLDITNVSLFKDTIEFEKLWEDKLSENLEIKDLNSSFKINDSKLTIDSQYITGIVDLSTKTGNLNIDKDYGIGGNLSLDYSNNQVDVAFTNLDVPLSLIEKTVYIKLIKLYGDNITGKLMITDLFNDPKFYGLVDVNSLKIKSLYTKDNEIEIPNLSVIFNEDKIYTNRVKARYFDVENNEYTNFYATTEILMPNFQFKTFSVDIECPNYLPAYIPLIGMNLTIDAKAKNFFSYSTDGDTSYLSGDLVVKDAVVRSGVDLPAWINPRQEVNGDFKITTAGNNSFYYPKLDNPILSLTMSPDQNFEFKFDSLTKAYAADGQIDILQGEIFYFQKNFYIDNGSLYLRVNSETNKLEPIISLEAKLRERDSDGSPVDIIISLNNNTLDNLNPIFSSIPSKSQQEIMSLLGQSFSSSTSTDSGSVASIATAATSVFSSLGYIDTGGVSTLNKTIATALNLDFFSLKSNIVENLILETFIEDPRYSSYSPLARYLNNTTIFMGKYLTQDSKFQIMINLLATSDSDVSSFLSDDLSLELEMSYEIDTDLAKFSFFTNPTQLSILDLLDTMGFSVTKTIHFR